jgi:hypothetical protein
MPPNIMTSGQTFLGPARRRLALLVWVVLAGQTPAAAFSRLTVSSLEVAPGEAAHVLVVSAITDFGFQGFSFSLSFDAGVIDVLEVARGGALESLGVDYFESSVSQEEGTVNVGALLELEGPFEAPELDGTGEPIELVTLLVALDPGLGDGDELPASTAVRFEEGLGNPPSRIRFSVENQSVAADELVDGVITISRREVFVRGDANRDARANVSDVVFVLLHLFGGKSLSCRDAADLNDDGEIGGGDAIFLLAGLFLDAPPPPPPYPEAGLDPTADALDCAR